MKISLSQIKNVLMEARDFNFFEDNFDMQTAILAMDEEKINTICEIITKQPGDYCEDILGENGGAEIIGAFFGNILDKWEKSKSFRPLILRFLPTKLQELIASQETPKSP